MYSKYVYVCLVNISVRKNRFPSTFIGRACLGNLYYLSFERNSYMIFNIFFLRVISSDEGSTGTLLIPVPLMGEPINVQERKSVVFVQVKKVSIKKMSFCSVCHPEN